MTEAAFIRACQEGKPEYQRMLVLRFSALLMTVARRYAGDDATAKDILQDAFVLIFRYLPEYRDTGSFTAWMTRIVVTTALKRMNSATFRREQALGDDYPESVVEPTVYAELEAETLLGLIQQLPEGYRQIFNLYVVEGYRHEEIATMLGISAATSRSQLARARERLQAMIRAVYVGIYL
jgi:RNA polymerase sigma-70 factor (ECF subfamily)